MIGSLKDYRRHDDAATGIGVHNLIVFFILG
jgi:hypothetical protein